MHAEDVSGDWRMELSPPFMQSLEAFSGTVSCYFPMKLNSKIVLPPFENLNYTAFFFLTGIAFCKHCRQGQGLKSGM